MAKKLTVILLAAAMMLGVFGLAGCDNVSLVDYKETKSNELQAYADAKGQSNYSENGWEAVCKAVIDGKAAIMDAATKPAVSTAFDEAKSEIDSVDKAEVVGAFYTLEEAFENGWITQSDLKDIAFYYRGSSEDGFVASPKNPAVLSASTESRIKQTYLKDLKKHVQEATLADIRILEYYGTYNNYVAVKVWDDCVDYDLSFIPEKFIGGVLFINYCGREIFIYKSAK